jgi:murein DD-endopeptidase MepM/ murein hydrolase activator NlpD
MASISDSLRTSSINITNISKSLFETKRSVSSVNDSVSNISKIIATNTRVKRELFANTQLIESRRREAAKRQEIEDQLESSRVSTSPSRGLAFAGRSDKGPLGRLVGFLGFITAGWIVENLPTWIFMGQEFVTRIQIFGRTMYNMVGNMQNIIKSFGSVLENSFNAIITLDFNSFSEGSVAQSFDELNLAVQGLGDEITETFRLFTTPLNESVETGEQAPALDEERPDTMFPEEDTASSGTVSPQAVYSYLRQLGVPHIHALGILANIQGESGFQIGVTEKGGTKSGVGLFQYSFPSRKNAFLKAVPDYKTNWKGQVDFAIKNDPNTPLYLRKQFNTPEEAADDWMIQWENPSKGVYAERRRKHNQFIKNFKPSSGQPQKPSVTPQTPLATSFTPVTGTSGASMGNKPLSVPYSPFKPGSGATITSGKGMRWGKQHKGYDIAAASGTPLYAYFPGKVTHIGIDGTASSAGYGNWVVWQDDMYGAYHFFGHMRNRPSVSVGQVINQGTLMGYVGSTGESTGPHLHWEISNNPPQSNGQFTSFEDPGSWLKRHPLKYAKPGAITSQPSTPPAQISFPSSRMGQPAAMTPERKGSQIIFIDDTQPQAQAPQVSYPSQQPTVTPTITEFKLLNNFIKNKLLLDLAYL